MGRMDPGLAREERRTITALFADLVGSTSIGERFDPEDVRDIVGGALAIVVEIVERYGGIVRELAGDGALVFFGAPIAHEDDAERAVRVGLEITEGIATYAAEARRVWGLEGFNVRVGIETGLAVLGMMGTVGAAQYGDVLNTSSRLQAQATPGTVLVGDTTRRIVEDAFQWGERRELELKGKSSLVGASVALRVRGVEATSDRPTPGRETQLVGRGAELDVIDEAIAVTMAGRPSILILTGEPGVGKSRLMAECHTRFAVAGGRWWEARCRSFAGSTPYGPYRDLVYSWFGDPRMSDAPIAQMIQASIDELIPGAQGESVALLAAMLGAPPDDPSTLIGIDAEEMQRRTFDGVERLVSAMATRGPIAVAIEDLHWADATSIALTDRLVSNVNGPVLFVLTRRAEPDHPSADLVNHLIDGGATPIALVPLSTGAGHALLEGLVGTGVLPPALERELLDTTAGNPLFLEEQVRALADAGALVRDGDGWRFVHEVPFEVSPSVEKVILARIDRLDPAARDLLVTAAVLGREFPLALLRSVIDEPTPDQQLDQLQQADLLRRRDSGDYAFKHALIQETAERSLLKRRRRELHLRAAESLAVDERADPGPTGDHFLEGGEPARAMPYLLAAARGAEAAFANDEAIAWYRLASDSGTEAELVLDARERLADVLRLVGRYAEAEDVLRRALAEAPELNAVQHANLVSRLAAVVMQDRERLIEANDTFTEALAILGEPAPQEPDEAWWDEWFETQMRLIDVQYWIGDADRMTELIEVLRPAVAERATPLQRASFHDQQSSVIYRRERYAPSVEAAGHTRAQLAAVLETNDRLEEGWARFNLGFSLLWNGELEESARELDIAVRLGNETGMIPLVAYASTYLTIVRRRQGDVDELEALIPGAAAATEAHPETPWYRAAIHGNTAWVALQRGNRDLARSAAEAAVEIWESVSFTYPFEWIGRWPLIVLADDDGSTEDAVPHLRRLLDEELQWIPEPLRSIMQQTCDEADRGRADDAAVSLKAAVELAHDSRYL